MRTVNTASSVFTVADMWRRETPALRRRAVYEARVRSAPEYVEVEAR